MSSERDASVTGPDPTIGTGIAHAVLLVTILVVAANLRPTITALGSVVGLIAVDTGMGAGALGLLGAIPLLMFAAVSPVVHFLTRVMGAERAVLVSTLVLIMATVVRSLPGSTANLWIGTIVMGAAIAVGKREEHLAAVLVAERGRVERQQRAKGANAQRVSAAGHRIYAFRASRPVARASASSRCSRWASATATARPRRVNR